MSDKIARPYAAAAFAHAKAQDAVAEWGKMFAVLAASADAVAGAARAYPTGEMQLAEALCELLKLHDDGQKNFLTVVAQNRRVSCLGAIARRFAELQNEDEGVAVMRVESAVSMGALARRDFDAFLAAWSGKKVRAEYAENCELLGGVRVYAKDHVLDASVRGRMDRLAAALT